MDQLDLSIIIPTYNFQFYIEGLLESLRQAQFTECVKEIIFVNDGSTDNTIGAINDLKLKFPELPILLLNLEKNQGRFTARLEGAKFAKGKLLFFIDSRIKLVPKSALKVTDLLKKSEVLMADIKIDESVSNYSLYWKRTHDLLFKGSFEQRKNPLFIDSNNFHSQLSGTGAIIIPRDLFLKHATSFDSKLVLSDDNALLQRIAHDKPIYIDPGFYVYWEPRQSFYPFVMRMFERGPSFVEYHVFKHQSLYFYIVIIGLILSLAILGLLVIQTLIALQIIFILFTLLVLSTIPFSKSRKEFFELVPIHCGTILFFGFGIIWGLFVNTKKFIMTKGSLGY